MSVTFAVFSKIWVLLDSATNGSLKRLHETGLGVGAGVGAGAEATD